jgi:hypothetical protein
MIFSTIFMMCTFCWCAHILLGINCPVSHVSTNQTYQWWWWKFKNLGEVTLDLTPDQETVILRELFTASCLASFIDFRNELQRDYNILVYYSSKAMEHEFGKTLVFRSAEERTLFILRYT